MKRSQIFFVLLLSLSMIFVVAACKKPDKTAPPAAKKAETPKGQPDKTAGPIPENAVMPAGHPDISGQKAAEAPLDMPVIKGKVKETLNSSGYTYVLLESEGRKIWVAIPEAKITIGKEMSFEAGQEIKNFQSKTLNRTFDTIMFSAGIAGKPGKSDDFMKKHTAQKEVQGAISGKVVETMDSGGYTYVALEKDGKKTWVAVRQMKVKVGSTMSFKPGAEMPNFKSDSLNRTFDSIIFSDGPISK